MPGEGAVLHGGEAAAPTAADIANGCQGSQTGAVADAVCDASPAQPDPKASPSRSPLLKKQAMDRVEKGKEPKKTVQTSLFKFIPGKLRTCPAR